jgi:hypothetical protein
MVILRGNPILGYPANAIRSHLLKGFPFVTKILLSRREIIHMYKQKISQKNIFNKAGFGYMPHMCRGLHFGGLKLPMG